MMASLEGDEPPKKRQKISSEDMVGPSKSIKKEEFVRVVIQSLYSLGYQKSGAALEEESGIQLFSSRARTFRDQLLNREWDQSLATLREFSIQNEDILKAASMLICEEKFFELLEKGRDSDAVRTLRNEITPLGINQMRLKKLCGRFIGTEPTAKSELKLVDELAKLLPPTVLLPEKILENLVEQTLNAQKKSCVHLLDSLSPLSLYKDHRCQIPSRTLQILHEHNDEVQLLQFSNDGKYLASASRGNSAFVWEVHEDGQCSLKHKLTGHSKHVVKLAWSPDGQELLTCGDEGVVKCWNIISGICRSKFEKENTRMITCGWPLEYTEKPFIYTVSTASMYHRWFFDGTEYGEGRYCPLSLDVVRTKEGRNIGCVLGNAIGVIGKGAIWEEGAITSFSLSRDENFLLVNLVNQEIHLWSIEGDFKLVMEYKGHRCSSGFVVRSCFGGYGQAFIASGSKDSQVYIWLRSTGELMTTLPGPLGAGHSDAVNCVSWHPTNHILASASDDKTIRIWGL